MSESLYPASEHTGGSIAGFTPNMSAAQIAEFDRRRGMGDMGAFNDPDLIINKQPWLRPDGTHKSAAEDAMDKTKEATAMLRRAMKVPEGENFAKEKDVQDDDKDFTDKLFGKADRGPSQSSIRDRERANGRKERSIAMRHLGKGEDGPLETEKDDVNVLEQLLSHEKKEAREEGEGKGLGGGMHTTMGPRGMGAPGGGAGGAMPPMPKPPAPAPAMTSMSPKSVLPGELSHMQGGDGGVRPSAPAPAPAAPPPTSSVGAGPSMGIGGKGLDTLKALNSRSMYIQRPMHDYDPFNVQRSAQSIPFASALPHEGAALTQKAQDTDETCSTHGTLFQKDKGCTQCKIAKCGDCEKCGAGMNKSFGGVLRCPRGH